MKEYQSIHDFLMDESFSRYVLQKDHKDIEQWEAYLERHPEQYELILKAKTELLDMHNALVAIDGDENYQRLEPYLGKNLKKMPSRNRWQYYAAACIALVLMSVASLWIIKSRQVDGQTEAMYATPPSQRKSLTLPDGTLVKLNADSRIEIAEGFGKSNRAITLIGEAYMEVAKNPDLPFVISTSTMNVRVLGTILNIRAYANEDLTAASLIEGSAEVILKYKDISPVRLKPMDKFVTSTEGQESEIVENKVSLEKIEGYKLESVTKYDEDQRLAETSWTEQKLVFINEPLSSIAKTLERWYNIKIEFETAGIKDRKYTAAFDESEELQSVLESLRVSMPFVYRKTGPRTISITTTN